TASLLAACSTAPAPPVIYTLSLHDALPISFTYYRSGRLGKFIDVQADIVEEHLKRNPDVDPDNLPNWFVTAMRLSPEAHADVQYVIQRWIDSSISKTVNAPRGYSVEQVEKVYERLYKGGAKG